MNTQIKYRLLLVFSMLCLIGLAVQGAYLWQLNARLNGTASTSDPRVRAIEEKILAEIDPPGAASGNVNTFNWPQSTFADPFSSLQQMQQQMDSLFGSFGFGGFGGFGGIGGISRPNSFSSMTFSSATPRIEVSETPTEYRITIPVTPDEEIELNTSVEDNALSVSGTIKNSANNQNQNFAASVFSQSQFSRTINLPEPVDEFGLTTQQTDSEIIISVPKKTV